MNNKVLNKLIIEAEKAKKLNEIPVSAVIVDQLGNIISYAHNMRQNKYNILGHAEILAIQKAEKKIKDWRLDGFDMYVNLEPCEMCSIIIRESRINNVFYFVSSNTSNNYKLGNIKQLNDDKYSEYKDKFKADIKEFFKEKR